MITNNSTQSSEQAQFRKLLTMQRMQVQKDHGVSSLMRQTSTLTSPDKYAHLSDIENRLLEFITEIMSENGGDHNIRKLVFLPVGVPGMGKTTLGRFLESVSQHIEIQIRGFPVRVFFKRVSYDIVFTELQQEFLKENPDVEFQAAFDIIRASADKEFNKQITEACKLSVEDQFIDNIDECDEKSQMIVDILYVDKNNTPDQWEKNQQLLNDIASHEKEFEMRTVLLIPEQTEFDRIKYTYPNPICPQFIYECLFRIFSRKNHCLSNENKPKAVEVVLKYMRFFDNIDFDDHSHILKYFNFCLPINFVKYDEQTISDETLSLIIESFNETPLNFVPPSEEVKERLTKHMEHVIEHYEEDRLKEMELFNNEIKKMGSQKDELFH